MRFFTGIRFTVLGGVAIIGCAQQDEDTTIDITHDVCQSIVVGAAGATDVQLAGIDDAITLWHPRGVTQLTRQIGAGAPPAMIDIVFDQAAAPFRGQYDDEVGRIWINAGLSEPALGVVIAHELGHAFGLVHVRAEDHSSVMNPGNTKVIPTVDDQLALESLWGICATP